MPQTSLNMGTNRRGADFYARALLCARAYLFGTSFPSWSWEWQQSTDADEGPRSRVCTRATFRSAPRLTSMVFINFTECHHGPKVPVFGGWCCPGPGRKLGKPDKCYRQPKTLKVQALHSIPFHNVPPPITIQLNDTYCSGDGSTDES